MFCEASEFLSWHFRASISLHASVQFKNAFFLHKSPPTASLPSPPSLSLSWKRLPEPFNTLFGDGSASITFYSTKWNSTKITSSRCTLRRQSQELNLLLLGISENDSPISLPLFFISLALRVLFTSQWVHRGDAHKLHTRLKKDPLGLTGPSGQEVPPRKSSRRPYITTTPLQCQAINGNTIISIKYVRSLWCSLFWGRSIDEMSLTNHQELPQRSDALIFWSWGLQLYFY